MIKDLIIIILLFLIFNIIYSEEDFDKVNYFIKANDANQTPIELYNIKEDSYTNTILDNNFINNNNINQDDGQQIYKSRIELEPNNWSPPESVNNINCCLVSKDLNNFKYNYQKLSNDECDINLYNINHERQLLFDNVNNWSNNYCSNNLDDQILGSCRRDNFECVDFIDKNTCDNFNNGIKLSQMKEKNTKVEWNKEICNIPVYKLVTYNEYNVNT